VSNQFTFKSELTPNQITFNNPEPVAKITPDGVMHFTVDASDENAKRFIKCIDNMLTQMGRGELQSVSVTAENRCEPVKDLLTRTVDHGN